MDPANRLLKTSTMNEQLDNFARAFTSHTSGCRRDCECGRTFWDASANGWDWEDNEIEALIADKNATAVDYFVGSLIIYGKEYCADCSCWHETANKIIDWLDHNSRSVIEFWDLEKKRKVQEAADSPVYTEWFPMTIAPRNATAIKVKMRDGTIHQSAHWASDLSGEEQPPFQGWFIPNGVSNDGIEDPLGWMPIEP